MFKAKRAHLTSLEATAVVVFLFSVNAAIYQSDQPVLAHKYVAQADEAKSFVEAQALRIRTKDGRIILGGNVILPTSKPYQGVQWRACVSPDGGVLWSARAQEQPDRASYFPVITDGDSIWTAGLLKSGIFRLAKFEARTLRKEASLQMTFEPAAVGSYIQWHSQTDPDFDLQISIVQPIRDSLRIALFSRDLRLLLDKTYAFPLDTHSAASRVLTGAYLTRIPDRSGYYLFLRHPMRSDAKSSPGVGILRLDNSGAVKWANTYAIGYSDFEAEPRVADDGSILIHFVTIPDFANKPLIKIGPNGITNWAMSIEGASASLADFNVGPLLYRFIEPYLFVSGGRLASTKLFSFVFAINYQTGKIEKQIKFTSPGGIGFIEKTANSLYVSLLNQAMQAMSARLVCQAALLRFDFDLNLRAAKSIRNAEPHWPILHVLPSGKLLFSYSYNARKTLVAETVNDNFESTNSCDVLQKADFSVTKSNFEARPISVVTTPLPPIKVSDANGRTSEADLAPVPFELTAIPCEAKVP